MTPKKPKPANDMTTNEVVDHLFHPDMGEALRAAIDERDEPIATDQDGE
jgi:hypothetical protein